MDSDSKSSLKKPKTSFKTEEIINYEDGGSYRGNIKNGLKDGKGKLET